MITISDWAIVLATLVGPIAAVLISLKLESLRAKRTRRQGLLTTLLNTMNHPGDPGYQMAVKAVAVEFRNDAEVMKAHREFMNSANLGPDSAVAAQTHQKMVALLTVMFARLGTKVSEDDVRGMSYTSVGFVQREALVEGSLKAIGRIADNAEAQFAFLKNLQANQSQARGEGQ